MSPLRPVKFILTLRFASIFLYSGRGKFTVDLTIAVGFYHC